MAKMTLRELCEATGVSRRAIQGYEKAKLVAATEKNKYGHLIYDELAQKRIKKVKLYQDFGFRIREIKELIDAPPIVVKAALQNKLEEMKIEKERRQALIELACDLIDKIPDPN